MSFVSNGGKFKLYTVPNGLLFSTPTQPRFSFERMIILPHVKRAKVKITNSVIKLTFLSITQQTNIIRYF
jgi:hypothetical protein